MRDHFNLQKDLSGLNLIIVYSIGAFILYWMPQKYVNVFTFFNHCRLSNKTKHIHTTQQTPFVFFFNELMIWL